MKKKRDDFLKTSIQVPLLTEFFKNEEEGVVQFTPTDLSSQIQEKFGKK